MSYVFLPKLKGVTLQLSGKVEYLQVILEKKPLRNKHVGTKMKQGFTVRWLELKELYIWVSLAL